MPGRLQQQLRQRRLIGYTPERIFGGAFHAISGKFGRGPLLPASCWRAGRRTPDDTWRCRTITGNGCSSPPAWISNYNTAAPPQPSHAGQCLRQSGGLSAAFQKTGTWPDKTILIKENRMAESAGTLSKAGQFQAGRDESGNPRQGRARAFPANGPSLFHRTARRRAR